MFVTGTRRETVLICNGNVTVVGRVFGVLVLLFFLYFQSPYSKNILIHGWFIITIIKMAAISAQNTLEISMELFTHTHTHTPFFLLNFLLVFFIFFIRRSTVYNT